MVYLDPFNTCDVSIYIMQIYDARFWPINPVR